MRKAILLLCVILLSCLAGHAQPQAYDSKVDYEKTQQTAAAIDLPYSTDLVEDAIKDYMSRKGLKGSGQKGFTAYRGVRLSDGDTLSSDLYFKVVRRNKDKNASTVSLIVGRPNEDIATRAPGASLPLDGAKVFLNNLVPSVEASDLEMQIKGQEGVAKKAQKKYNNLQDDQTALEKKIRNAQADLDENKRDQVKATADMQTNLNLDNDAVQKARKKLNKLLDQQGSLEKKIRNWQTSLDQNKNDQVGGLSDMQKQQQVLDTMKLRRKS